MEDDDLLFDIRESQKKSRTSFQSVINKKIMCDDELDDLMNEF